MLFFFDIDDGNGLVRDELGTDLPNLKAARDEAICVLPGVARDIFPDGDDHTLTATVRDQSGTDVFRVRLSLSTEWLHG